MFFFPDSDNIIFDFLHFLLTVVSVLWLVTTVIFNCFVHVSYNRDTYTMVHVRFEKRQLIGRHFYNRIKFSKNDFQTFLSVLCQKCQFFCSKTSVLDIKYHLMSFQHWYIWDTIVHQIQQTDSWDPKLQKHKILAKFLRLISKSE